MEDALTLSPDGFAGAYEFLQVNGFVYRGNRATGEFWRLETDPRDRKKQVWAKIDDRPVATT